MDTEISRTDSTSSSNSGWGAAHDLFLHQAATHFVQGQLSSATGALAVRSDWMDRIAASLMRRARARLLEDHAGQRVVRDKHDVPEAEQLEALFHEELSSALVASAQDDATVLWCLTFAMVDQSLQARLRPGAREANSLEGERLAEIRAGVLSKLAGGHNVLRKYLDEQNDGKFWHYLRRSVTNAITDRLRPKNKGKEFREGREQVIDTFHGEESGQAGRVLTARSAKYSPERHVARQQRWAERRRTVQTIRAFAAAHSKDRHCLLVCKFMDWILDNPDLTDHSQKAFADACGIKYGTVNSSLFRFRQLFKAQKDLAIDLHALYTTTGG